MVPGSTRAKPVGRLGLAVGLTLALSLASLPEVTGRPSALSLPGRGGPGADPGPDPAPDPGGPPGGGGARPPRILMLSSGLDAGAFGADLADQLVAGGDEVDQLGHGTYAASVALQAAPEAVLESVVVDGPGGVDAARLDSALAAAANRDDLDALLLAFPPASYVDPVSSAMDDGTWSDLIEVVGEFDADPGAATVFGIPVEAAAALRFAEGLPSDFGAAVRGFAAGVERWNSVLDSLTELRRRGVPVVMGAGDGGPGWQSVAGLAGLPEVMTVASGSPTGPDGTSAAGPSIHGGAKPDVMASGHQPGLLADGSQLHQKASAEGAVDPGLELALPGAGVSSLRALIPSTSAAAAAIAADAARFHAAGAGRAVDMVRAGANPVPGVSPLRQGAGFRAGGTPGAASDLVVSGSADLGPEPAAGTGWTAEVITAGVSVETATLRLTDRLVPGASGEIVHAGVPGASAPPVAVQVRDERVLMSLPAGDNQWRAGTYCGWLQVTGAASDSSHGARAAIPTCLSEGLTLDAFGFYIHDLPAEDETFVLVPTESRSMDAASEPMRMVPARPLELTARRATTGADGRTALTNVPPGSYTVRLFSDYGAPVRERFPDGSVRERDLGRAASYLAFDALVLPNPCEERIADHPTTGTECHRRFLAESTRGDVSYEKANARYVVATPAGSYGVLFDFMRAMPGTAVVSRVIDLVNYDDIDFGVPTDASRLGDPTGATDRWAVRRGSVGPDPDGVHAEFRRPRGLYTMLREAGTGYHEVRAFGRYPFSLTQPNKHGRLAVDFRYRLENAALGLIVTVDGRRHVRVLATDRTVELPAIGWGAPTEAAAIASRGFANGQAHFDFELFTQGAHGGTIDFVLTPLDPVLPARVELGDLSLELATWQRVPWPATRHDRPHGTVQGHLFSVRPNFSSQQVQGRCRPRLGAELCEAWDLLVHSPADDAETIDVVDDTGASVLSQVTLAGGGYFDPRRGTHSARHELAFVGDPAATGIGAPLVTNGRFWEQLLIPTKVLATAPARVDMVIADNQVGRASPNAPHRAGPALLPAYLPLG